MRRVGEIHDPHAVGVSEVADVPNGIDAAAFTAPIAIAELLWMQRIAHIQQIDAPGGLRPKVPAYNRLPANLSM